MGSVHFYCPTYQCEIDSGFETDEITLERARLNRVRVLCSACGRPHRFLLADRTDAAETRDQSAA
jgi:hypothetical protein